MHKNQDVKMGGDHVTCGRRESQHGGPLETSRHFGYRFGFSCVKVCDGRSSPTLGAKR